MNPRKQLVRLRVNGQEHQVAIAPNRLLLDVLREELGLTGTKAGCDDGSCGACSILVDGVPVQCCMMLAIACQDQEITTIEALAQNGEMHPLQKAFCDFGAQQCGFCTPGLILTAKALLDQNLTPTRQEISQTIAGNLCRCTGYTKILDAIEKAAEMLRGQGQQKMMGG
ncbi:MAG: (2Fe-2S)-binding protein [Acidobacteria bacterium]|nr:(2Fe-2S)-binding protein [Acidobacteriota bacterium]